MTYWIGSLASVSVRTSLFGKYKTFAMLEKSTLVYDISRKVDSTERWLISTCTV